MEKRNDFHKDLYERLGQYVHFVYKVTKKFPKEEVFGSFSQLRRVSLSVMLNYVEGFARVEKFFHYRIRVFERNTVSYPVCF